ncbi:hypothetical protein [Limosilactobacillus caccae]|uniref:hypothetical protein n=1 Tax=Limosilactobacillus caccae TaxID=1926284 RepID=UPI000970FF69|nr:hypothetical protein [Limosilactobacillus caccae]
METMNLSKFDRQARAKLVFNDNQVIIGKILSYTGPWNTEDDEEPYVTIVPESGALEESHVDCFESEVRFAKYLD